MRHYFFIVEGPHDLAAVGRVLKFLGIKEKTNINKVSDVWKALIPTRYPFEEDTLDRMSPVPSFYQSDDISIAIKVAGGETKIIEQLNVNMVLIPRDELKKINGILILCDADQKTANEKFDSLNNIIKHSKELYFDSNLLINKIGKFNNVEIKSDVYIFPNNSEAGTLENLLLKGAEVVYPDLLKASGDYVNLADSRYKGDWSISSQNKVIVGCIANIFKPGRANQVSIYENDWISEETIQKCDDIMQFKQFIENFIEH